MQLVPHVFRKSAEQFADNVMMWQHDGKEYQPSTYREMFRETQCFTVGLIESGLQKGEKVALLAEGRNSWVVSEFGIISAGGISVPLSVKLNESRELEFRINHSETSIIIVSSGQASKIRKIRANLKHLRQVIVMDPEDVQENEISMEAVIETGREKLEKNPQLYDEALKNLDQDDIINICYTSGTTSDPKGIMLSHRNYLTNTEQAKAIFHVPEYYTSLLILPWDHSFAHTVGVYTLMTAGASMASIQPGKTSMETLRNIPRNIREIKPHFLLSVPSLAKNFRKNIEKGIREKGGLRAIKIFNSALEIAYKYNREGYNRGTGIRAFLKIPYFFYDYLLFRKIRENFGNRLRFFVGGGALLDIELQRFFYAIGIPMYQGYGLTEAAPVISANTPNNHKLGSSGKVVPDMEVKICDSEGNSLRTGEKGEIVVKGDNVMHGYWKNKKGTWETLKDGWLYTGDMGYFDTEGYLYVTGRFKSLLISEDGEKFSPEGIEEALVENSRYIDQVMLYNNQSPYTVALIVPNRDALVRWLKNKHKLSPSDTKAVEYCISKIHTELQPFYDKDGKGELFPNRWLPSAVALLNEGFTEENKLLNSTMKMVLGKITEYYKERIESLFNAEAKTLDNSKNREAMQKLLDKTKHN